MTAREALEHVNGSYAFEALVAARRAAREESGIESAERSLRRPKFLGGAVLDADGESVLQAGRSARRVTVTGPKAEAVADKPHLTGGAWPEWDALELSETDPSKPPLKVRW